MSRSILIAVGVTSLVVACGGRSEDPAPATSLPDRSPTIAVPQHPRLSLAPARPTSLARADLATREAQLVANGRRAWRLGELVDASGDAVVRAITAGGNEYVLRDATRTGDDVLVVRRDSGALYIGFAASSGDRALADLERPAERIEDVVELTIASPEPRAQPALRPAAMAIERDGKPLQTLTATALAGLPQIEIDGRRAVDVERVFGRLVGLEADGAAVEVKPPSAAARPVVYVNRRERIKLAWVDAAGRTVGDKQREVTKLVVVSASRRAP